MRPLQVRIVAALLCLALSACGMEGAAPPTASPGRSEDAASSSRSEEPSPSGQASAGPAAAPERLRRVAEAFLEFARGRAAPPPLGDEVALLLGNTLAGTRDGRALHGRRAWSVCPPDGYAERSCPFSAIRSFSAEKLGSTTFTTEMPEEPCAHGPRLPPRLRSLDFVTARVEQRSACLDYLAVQLFVDDGDIVGVNLVLGSP